MRHSLLTIVLLILIPNAALSRPGISRPVCAIEGYQYEPIAVGDENGGAVVVWTDTRGDGRAIYAQRFDHSGAAQWQVNGIPVWEATESGYVEVHPAAISDDQGGAFVGMVVYYDDGTGVRYEWLIQHIDASGALRYDPRGVRVGLDHVGARGMRYLLPPPGLALDETGGVIISWGKWRTDTTYQDLHLQRVDSTGTPLWTPGGRFYPTKGRQEYYTKLVKDGSGGVIAVVKEWDDGHDRLRGLRVDALGTPQWAGEWLLLDGKAGGGLSHFGYHAITDDNGGAIVAALSADPVQRGLHVMRIGEGGMVMWNVYAEPSPPPADYPLAPAIIRSGSGGAIVGWGRGDDDSLGILVQKFSPSGEALWAAGGLNIGSGSGPGGWSYRTSRSPSLAPDGHDGALCVWSIGERIQSQQIDVNGNTLLGPTGRLVADVGNTDNLATVAGQGKSKGLVVYHKNGRNQFDPDIYATRFQDIPTVHGVLSSWRFVSIDKDVEDPALTTLFPTSVSSAHRFSGSGYVSEDALQTGFGYWIKTPGNPEAEVLTNIEGVPITSAAIDLTGGWHTIGALSVPISTASITTIPPDLIESEFFAYNGEYFVVDSLEPGRGYWVSLCNPGQLVLNSEAPRAKPGISIRETESFGAITITDAEGRKQRLLIGVGQNTNVKSYLMPPRSPEASFDARFASGRMAEVAPQAGTAEYPIHLSDAGYPITIVTANIPPEVKASLRIGNRIVLLENQGSIQVKSPSTLELILEGGEIPAHPSEYLLAQNFPNPFNPATSIEFVLPAAGHVRLTVFNALGQEVARLVDGVRSAGPQVAEFDAGHLPSGVYCYRLDAGSFQAVRKMLLVR